MLCLALGLGALGFVAMRKARRCRYGYYGRWGGWYGHHWHGRHRQGLYWALSRLDASPAQERAIISEVDKLRERVYEIKRGARDARGDLAAAVRGPTLDDAALGAVLGRVDAAIADIRAAILEAWRNIHAVLDDRQRGQVADILDHGWWRGGQGGPYRV